MGTRISIFVFSFFLISSFIFLFAEKSEKVEKNIDDSVSAEKSKTQKDNYYFNILENGDVEFKQVISWKNLFGANYYELSIREKESFSY